MPFIEQLPKTRALMELMCPELHPSSQLVDMVHLELDAHQAPTDDLFKVALNPSQLKNARIPGHQCPMAKFPESYQLSPKLNRLVAVATIMLRATGHQQFDHDEHLNRDPEGPSHISTLSALKILNLDYPTLNTALELQKKGQNFGHK